MKNSIIRASNKFLDLKVVWERLQQDDPTLTYNDTFEYNYNWWKSFEEGGQSSLFIFIVYSKIGEVVAILPLSIKTITYTGIKIKSLEFISKGDRHNFITLNDDTNKSKVFNLFISSLEQYKDEFDRVNLTHLDVLSPFSKYLLKHQKYNNKFNLLVETPLLIKNNHQSIAEYKKNYLSKNVKNLNNRLMKDVGYTFEVSTDNCIDEIAAIHKKQQREENREKRQSVFSDDNYVCFLRKLYSKNDHLTFLMKDKAGITIAYQTAYCHNGSLLFWNMGYDLQYSKYSIGRICIYKMVEYFFENPTLKSLDFGSGRYPWKFQWTSDMLSIYKLEFYVKSSKKIQLIERIKKLKKGLRCLLSSLKNQSI
jgi:CelD/BcsL family acetyltransferase involved in cellulose biosynthesis